MLALDGIYSDRACANAFILLGGSFDGVFTIAYAWCVASIGAFAITFSNRCRRRAGFSLLF
jgi:hypothetical protein